MTLPVARYAIPVLFACAFAVLWAVALSDLFRRADSDFPRLANGIDPRTWWTFWVVIGSGFGSLAYYLLVMRPRPRRR